MFVVFPFVPEEAPDDYSAGQLVSGTGGGFAE